MSIPFIRKFPNNKGALQMVERSAEIEAEALEFIRKGGWYTAEVTRSGAARLTATDDQFHILVVVDSPNDDQLLPAVDLLVKQSQQFLHRLVITKH